MDRCNEQHERHKVVATASGTVNIPLQVGMLAMKHRWNHQAICYHLLPSTKLNIQPKILVKEWLTYWSTCLWEWGTWHVHDMSHSLWTTGELCRYVAVTPTTGWAALHRPPSSSDMSANSAADASPCATAYAAGTSFLNGDENISLCVFHIFLYLLMSNHGNFWELRGGDLSAMCCPTSPKLFLTVII